jgi:putative nucleotidyltransferase with HDIG domain
MSVIPLKKRELDQLFLDAIAAIVAALEVKDGYTHGHSIRVAEYAIMMGKALSLQPWDLKKLELGALLHDIGKLGVPDAILNKNGKLTKEEFEVMKKHPLQSAHICSQIELLKDVVPIVKHHHERIDGLGYPDGLSDNKISLLTRVVFVVDAFDAMTSHRPYRKALTVAQAYEELLRCAGSQFDARLVQLFIKEHKNNMHLSCTTQFVKSQGVKKKAVGS